jgi:hypothetical protein
MTDPPRGRAERSHRRAVDIGLADDRRDDFDLRGMSEEIPLTAQVI